MTTEQEERLREKNRRRYPEIAKMMDGIREYFPEARIVRLERLTKDEAERRKEEWRQKEISKHS